MTYSAVSLNNRRVEIIFITLMKIHPAKQQKAFLVITDKRMYNVSIIYIILYQILRGRISWQKHFHAPKSVVYPYPE